MPFDEPKFGETPRWWAILGDGDALAVALERHPEIGPSCRAMVFKDEASAQRHLDFLTGLYPGYGFHVRTVTVTAA